MDWFAMLLILPFSPFHALKFKTSGLISQSLSSLCLLCKSSPKMCPWCGTTQQHPSPKQHHHRGVPCAAHMHPLVGWWHHRWAMVQPIRCNISTWFLAHGPWPMPFVRCWHCWWAMVHPIRRTFPCDFYHGPFRNNSRVCVYHQVAMARVKQ